MSTSTSDSTAGGPWEAIHSEPAFQELLARKKAFMLRSTLFFVIYYFALLVLVGWWPDFMKTQVLGKVNIAYLFALSQFFMAWILAWIYTRVAAQWDLAAQALLAKN